MNCDMHLCIGVYEGYKLRLMLTVKTVVYMYI